MSAVKRYDYEIEKPHWRFSHMVECPEGDYVEFDDYEKLRSENALLRKMISAIEFPPEYDIAIAHKVNGRSWFDVREDLAGKD